MSGVFVNAVQENDWKGVDLYLRHGQEVDYGYEYDSHRSYIRTTTPLVYACGKGYSETVEVLLNHGANSSGDYHGPISEAISNGRTECLRLLLEKVDADSTNFQKENFLCTAARRGKVECLKLLIESGKIDLYEKDKNYGREMLRTAARNNQIEVVKYLFACTAIDFNASDEVVKPVLLSSGSMETAKVIDELINERKNENTTTIVDESQDWKLKSIEIDIDLCKSKLLKIDENIEKLSNEKPAIENKLKKHLAEKDNYLKEISEKRSKQLDKLKQVGWNECPICAEVMKRPKTIYQCPEGHCFCGDCKPNLKLCPICRVDISNYQARVRSLENVINGDN